MLTFRHKLFATGASVVINGGFLLALAFWSPSVSKPTTDTVMEVSMEPLDLSAEVAKDSAAPSPAASAPPPPPPSASEPLPKPTPISDTKTPEKAPEKPAEKPADVRAEAPSHTAMKSPAKLTPAAPGNGRTPSDTPPVPTPGPAPAAQSAAQTAAKAGRHTASYLALVRRHVESFKVYPKQAKRRRMEGTVSLSFTIDRQGRLLSARITKGSGAPELDQAALDMLTAAQPMPKPPADVTGDRIDLNFMTEFSLED